MYKLVLFDFDGTILDSDGMIVATFIELYKKFKPGYEATIEHMLTFSGPPIKETLKKEFPELDQDFIYKEYQKVSTKNYDLYIKLFPGVEGLLLKLRSLGVPYGLVTSKSRDATNYAFSLLGIEGYFDFSVCSNEVKNVKPNPEGIRLAMKHFSIKNPKNVLYIGDGIIDYLTAKAANVDFGLVSYSPRKDLIQPEGVDLLIDDLNDILKVVSYEKD